MTEIKTYAFIGDVIKLTKEDCDKWRIMYPYLDMASELSQLDMELEARRREGGKVNKWFSECIARLNGRNKRAERNNRNMYPVVNSLPYPSQRALTTKEISIHDQLIDRDWAKH